MSTPPAPRTPSSQPPTLRRILLTAVASLTIGLGAVSVMTGFSDSPPVRLVWPTMSMQTFACVVCRAIWRIQSGYGPLTF